MNVITKEITIKTKHENQMIDLSDDINKEIKSSGLKDGIVTVFTRHSTGAITTIEYEPGLEKDFPAMLKRIAPDDVFYEHENTWHDGNGRSHVKASLIGSILGNLLLVLGLSLLWGGINHRQQSFSQPALSINGSLLMLAVLALIIPAAVHHAGATTDSVLELSRYAALILLFIIILSNTY